MVAKEVSGKWYIEVDTKEFGKVYLFEKAGLDALSFSSLDEANSEISRRTALIKSIDEIISSK